MTNQISYPNTSQYNYAPANNSYYSPYTPSSAQPQRSYTMNVGKNTPNTNLSGGMPYKQTPAKKGIKTILKKTLSPFKGLRPAHVITLGMLGIMFLGRGCVFSGTKANAGDSSLNPKAIKWAYQQGEQHVRDSVKIANLEKELMLAQDSVKLLKKMHK